MRFKYKAIDKYGNTKEGVIIAQGEDDVITYLARLDLTPISVSREKFSLIYSLISSYFEKISLDDKIYLFQNLSLMIRSGIDLGKGIDILIEETSSLSLKNFLINLKFNLEQGKKMSEVFSAFSNYFSNLEISIIAAGEESGKLETNINQLTQALIQAKQTRGKIISSLFYPLILIGMSFLLIIGILTFVLPKLAQVFKDLPMDIPLFTRLLFSLSLFFKENILIILILLIIFIFSFLILGFKFGLFKLIWKFLQFKVPFIKKMILYKSLADISFNFAILIDSGLPLIKIFELLEGVASYYSHKSGIREIREKFIPAGKSISEAFKETGVFPANFIALIGVGEKSGNIGSNLILMSNFYRENFEYMIKNFTTILEPVILVFVGILIGSIALGVILPIYNLITEKIK